MSQPSKDEKQQQDSQTNTGTSQEISKASEEQALDVEDEEDEEQESEQSEESEESEESDEPDSDVEERKQKAFEEFKRQIIEVNDFDSLAALLEQNLDHEFGSSLLTEVILNYFALEVLQTLYYLQLHCCLTKRSVCTSLHFMVFVFFIHFQSQRAHRLSLTVGLFLKRAWLSM